MLLRLLLRLSRRRAVMARPGLLPKSRVLRVGHPSLGDRGGVRTPQPPATSATILLLEGGLGKSVVPKLLRNLHQSPPSYSYCQTADSCSIIYQKTEFVNVFRQNIAKILIFQWFFESFAIYPMFSARLQT